MTLLTKIECGAFLPLGGLHSSTPVGPVLVGHTTDAGHRSRRAFASRSPYLAAGSLAQRCSRHRAELSGARRCELALSPARTPVSHQRWTIPASPTRPGGLNHHSSGCLCGAHPPSPVAARTNRARTVGQDPHAPISRLKARKRWEQAWHPTSAVTRGRRDRTLHRIGTPFGPFSAPNGRLRERLTISTCRFGRGRQTVRPAARVVDLRCLWSEGRRRTAGPQSRRFASPGERRTRLLCDCQAGMTNACEKTWKTMPTMRRHNSFQSASPKATPLAFAVL